MKAQKKRLGPGIVSLLIALVIMAVTLGGYAVLRRNYQSDFVPGEYYGQELPNRYSARREVLAQRGVTLTVPGTGGQVLTVTVPKAISLYNYGFVVPQAIDTAIPKGAEITTDFVTWTEYQAGRSITLTYNGKTYDTYMKTSDVVKLYKAALKQNGLEAQFQADTGKSLSTRSAKKAIQSINKQIYDLGLYAPEGYPYNFRMVNYILAAILGLSPLLAFIGSALYVFVRMVQADNEMLAKYNAEHIESWDKKSGTLPQFTSYSRSGIRGPGEGKKPSFREVVQGMFRVQK